jgi:hypothetical protein
MRLDKQYATPEGRWHSLRALRSALTAVTPYPGVGVAESTTHSLAADETDHLKTHWFTAAGFWNSLQKTSTSTINGNAYDNYTGSPLPNPASGEKILVQGLVQALEVSLGLETGQSVPDLVDATGTAIPDPSRPGSNMLDIAGLKKNLPVDVYWVCGKFDGFEVQVAWNDQQVTVLIVTPPLRAAASTLNGTTNMNTIDNRKANRSRGFLVVSAPGASPNGVSWLRLNQGGVGAGA